MSRDIESLRGGLTCFHIGEVPWTTVCIFLYSWLEISLSF